MSLALIVLFGAGLAYYVFDVAGCTLVIGDTLTTLVGVSCPVL